MKALVLKKGEVSLQADLPMPDVDVNTEVLVKILLAGVCATDLALMQGLYDFDGILGHEWVGEVVEGPEEWLGRRVVGEINIACGQCRYCLSGLQNHCLQRQVTGIRQRSGAFAEYMSLPIANLHRVPDSVTLEQAVWAEPLAAALQVLEVVDIKPSYQLLVIGDGRLAQLIARVLQLTGADVTVLGKYPNKLALLPEGVQRVLLSTSEPMVGLQRDYDCIVEASGNETALSLATEYLIPGGTLVLKSTYADNTSFPIVEWVVKELRVVGSRCGPFAAALRVLAQHRLDLSKLISARYALDDGLNGLEHARTRGALKILIDNTSHDHD